MCQKVVKKLSKKLSKVVKSCKKLSKSYQKSFQKVFKSYQKSCQKVVKSCQKGWGQKVLSKPSADSFAVGRRQKLHPATLNYVAAKKGFTLPTNVFSH
jgi:hypothetical protein